MSPFTNKNVIVENQNWYDYTIIKWFSIDLQNSWLIGDKTSDIQTAINANIPNKILIGKDTNSLFNTIK